MVSASNERRQPVELGAASRQQREVPERPDHAEDERRWHGGEPFLELRKCESSPTGFFVPATDERDTDERDEHERDAPGKQSRVDGRARDGEADTRECDEQQRDTERGDVPPGATRQSTIWRAHARTESLPSHVTRRAARNGPKPPTTNPSVPSGSGIARIGPSHATQEMA
nr:hypothetical protein [Halomicroarcula sp. ZS-22-S1]